MLLNRRLLAVASAGATVMISGGAAWAAAGVTAPAHHAAVHVLDVTTSTDETTTSVGDTTTSVGDTTTSVADDVSTTSVGDTTTTSVEDTTTTTVGETTTTATTTTTTSPPGDTTGPTGPCKPGWGYGDTNHCHSGPPGLNKHHSHGNH